MLCYFAWDSESLRSPGFGSQRFAEFKTELKIPNFLTLFFNSPSSRAAAGHKSWLCWCSSPSKFARKVPSDWTHVILTKIKSSSMPINTTLLSKSLRFSLGSSGSVVQLSCTMESSSRFSERWDDSSCNRADRCCYLLHCLDSGNWHFGAMHRCFFIGGTGRVDACL